MRINITAGDCLNSILSARYPNELFIPFREAMIKGEYSSLPFSESFLLERANTHNVSLEEYKKHMESFLSFLSHLVDYDEVVLWFGEEPFCLANIDVILKTLKNKNYTKSLTLNTVIEETGEIVKSVTIQ